MYLRDDILLHCVADPLTLSRAWPVCVVGSIDVYNHNGSAVLTDSTGLVLQAHRVRRNVFQCPSFSVYITVVILIPASFYAYSDIFLQCQSAYSCHRAMEIAPGVGAGGRPAPSLGYCKHLRSVVHAFRHRVLCVGPSVCISRLRRRTSHAIRDYSQGGVRRLFNGREAVSMAESHAVAGTRLLSREH